MNGAESLVRSLHKAGVELCLANPGTSEMQFVDALDRTRLLRCVLGLFEGVVTGAADGYARMAGKPAVTLLHLAPGLGNAAANMHNARKARTPMLNLVGDHAVRHLAYDAPLTGDVAGAAAPFSDWVHTATAPDTIARDAVTGLAVAMGRPGRVATLIAPADIGWDNGGVVADPVCPEPARALDPQAVDAAAAALGPDTLILVGGCVLESPEALALLGGVAERTGAALMAPTSNRRIERGAGRVNLAKIPYPVDMALAALARFRTAILIEAKPPVAFFAYPDRPSLLLPEDCAIIQLADVDQDGPAAVAALASGCGARPVQPVDAPPATPPAAARTRRGMAASTRYWANKRRNSSSNDRSSPTDEVSRSRAVRMFCATLRRRLASWEGASGPDPSAGSAPAVVSPVIGSCSLTGCASIRVMPGASLAPIR